jgi:tetratricopeptide (TPR) repeat protein
MNHRRLLVVGLVLGCSSFASAQDARVLSGKSTEDVAFARSLVDGGYPELAVKLLAVLEKQGGESSKEAKAAVVGIKHDVALEEARKLDDPVAKKTALVAVLKDKEKFVEEYKGSQAAEDARNTLPDLYNVIGETIATAVKKIKDPGVLEALRSEGDALFLQAEAAIQKRTDELKVLDPKTEEDINKQMISEYNHARTLYFHALLFAPGSDRRMALCNQAIAEYDEFDLNYSTTTILGYWAAIDTAGCLKETAKPDEAIKRLDLPVSLRESYGEQGKDGLWPVPDAAGDVKDLFCYAMLQKALIYRDQKKFDKVVEVGKDYFSTTPKPFDPASSMGFAKELAEAQLALGDSKGARATAEMMKAADSAGIGDAWGREILERLGGGDTPFTEKLKSAETYIMQNNFERGLALCRQVIADVAGTPNEQEGSCDALLDIGFAYERRNLTEEAAIAYETAVEKYPMAKNAPECCSRAIDSYQRSYASARRKGTRDHVEQLTDTLINRYAKAPQAADAVMKKAKALEGEGDYQAAVDIYKRVEKSSVNYTRAKVSIALCYGALGNALAKDKKDAEAKAAYAAHETALKEAIDAIKAHPVTMDQKVIDAYDTQEYICYVAQARLFMQQGRPQEASAVVEILEKNSKWTSDPQKGPEIQDLRGKLFLSAGKFDEAEKWIDDLAKRDRKAAAGPAGRLARVFDEMGQDKRKEKADSIEADNFWKRAAKLYYMSIKPQVDGSMSQDAGEMTGVGNRFFAYGLHFNGVAEKRASFVGWTPDATKRAPDYWNKAAEIYEAALAQTPDYRMTINLGRTYGFLAKWPDAVRIYSKLFEQEQMLTKDKRKLDPNVTKVKGELVFAYLEWGVAEWNAYQADNDKGHLTRCRDVIFTPLQFTLKPDTSPEAYWGSRYYLVRTLMDLGAYTDAKLSIEDAKRNVSPTFDNGEFGYKPLLEAALDECEKKTFNK